MAMIVGEGFGDEAPPSPDVPVVDVRGLDLDDCFELDCAFIAGMATS
ncbi:MAG: hypothetical protein AAF590_13105 [Pseudomonadota bacterium]